MYNNDELEQDIFDEPSAFQKGFAFLWEIIKIVAISLAIIIPIRYFIVQPFFVNGASMEDTFHDNDYILIDEITYRFDDPVRGDIVVFKYPNNTFEFFIKRVIGLPGETVEVKNNNVVIYNSEHTNGIILGEEYLSRTKETSGNLTVHLEDDEYFVMGDNRPQSSDSRYWGPVKRSLITGRVFARAWPLKKATFFEKPTY